MKTILLVAVVLLSGFGAAEAQEEKPVPKDSERIAVPGCAKGRTFIVADPAEHEPIRSNVQPGRRLRLNGPKKVLDEIKARESSRLEITGLIRKGATNERGIGIAGGRVRIGGALPRDPIYGDARRDPMYNEVVIDVESWRMLGDACHLE